MVDEVSETSEDITNIYQKIRQTIISKYDEFLTKNQEFLGVWKDIGNIGEEANLDWSLVPRANKEGQYFVGHSGGSGFADIRLSDGVLRNFIENIHDVHIVVTLKSIEERMKEAAKKADLLAIESIYIPTFNVNFCCGEEE